MKRIKTIAVSLLLPALLMTGCSFESIAEKGAGLLDKLFSEDNLASIPSVSIPATDTDPASEPDPPAPAVPVSEEPDIASDGPAVPDVSVQFPAEPVQTTAPSTPAAPPEPDAAAAAETVTPSHTDVTFFSAGESFRYLPKGVSGTYACTYSVDDDKIASVDSNTGTVKAVAPGTTKVKMHVESNGQYDFECIVRCNWKKDDKTAQPSDTNKTDKPANTQKDDEPVLPPASANNSTATPAVTASHSDATFFNPKEHFKLVPTGAGAGCPSTYSSSDSTVAAVGQDGTVTAVGPGTATITMTVDCGGSDYTLECIVRCKWEKTE
ncbi:MAG: Ig-like domain-containing protein [Oscillospiraceae bacterium]|nr:Ig-like domain-containing protein [Oscillospiraceae bacterium]